MQVWVQRKPPFIKRYTQLLKPWEKLLCHACEGRVKLDPLWVGCSCSPFLVLACLMNFLEQCLTLYFLWVTWRNFLIESGPRNSLKEFSGAMFIFVFFVSHMCDLQPISRKLLLLHTQSPHLFASPNVSPSLPLSAQGRYKVTHSKCQCIRFFYSFGV